MDAAELIGRLAYQDKPPVGAIRAASADRKSAAPVFVNAVEEFVRPGGDRSAEDSLYFIFHLLGDWREKSAYRPLARLMRCCPDDLDRILGGAITETTHRVMAAVFDGDPAPLYDVIRDPKADQFVRARMLETIAMVTLRGEMPRAEAARFLQSCYYELEPQGETWTWHGWQCAIALLGLVELKPLVEQAFARGSISSDWLGFADFEQDLQHGIDDPAALLERADEYSLFGDTIEEFSSWLFRPEDTAPRGLNNTHRSDQLWQAGTAVKRHRNVGRNDPCPCGSGLKFKKCCLTLDLGLAPLRAMGVAINAVRRV